MYVFGSSTSIPMGGGVVVVVTGSPPKNCIATSGTRCSARLTAVARSWGETAVGAPTKDRMTELPAINSTAAKAQAQRRESTPDRAIAIGSAPAALPRRNLSEAFRAQK